MLWLTKQIDHSDLPLCNGSRVSKNSFISQRNKFDLINHAFLYSNEYKPMSWLYE